MLIICKFATFINKIIHKFRPDEQEHKTGTSSKLCYSEQKLNEWNRFPQFWKFKSE